MGRDGALKEPVAVVVLAAGRAATLERCLEALSAQESPADLVVSVVDSAPSDGAADKALRNPAVHWVLLTSRAGVGALCQRASEAVQFQRVALLDAAYEPEPGWLDGGMAQLAAGVELAIGGAAESARGGHGFADMFFAKHVVDRIRFEASGSWNVAEFARRCEAAGFCVATRPRARLRLISGSSPQASSDHNGPPTAGLAPPSVPRPAKKARLATQAQDLVSVVLCTAGRRPEQLQRCLNSLAALDDPNFEILLVDNSARPALGVDQLPTAVKYVHEPRRGLDYARNRGIRESSGDIIAFVDDDCEVHLGWLSGIRDAFSDLLVSFVTGRVRPWSLDRPSQQWFETRFPFDRGPRSRRVTPFDNGGLSPLRIGEIGTGANMAFRRSTLDRTGGFDVSLDMGTLIGGGGDLDVFARVLHQDVCEYAADAVVFHHHRDSLRKLRWQTWGYGISQGAMCAKYFIHKRGKRLHALAQYLRLLRDHKRRLAATRSGEDRFPPELVLIELVGIALGPAAYLASVAQQRRLRSR